MKRCILILALLSSAPQLSAFEIQAFSANGAITWSDPYSNGHFRVQWCASRLSTNWHDDWSSLSQIRSTGGTVTAEIPMFFRVAYFPATIITDSMPFVLVPGGGQPGGPTYDFYMGKYEVTVEQFITFLNDAQAHAGDARGTNMFFFGNGDVYMDVSRSQNEVLFDISNSYLVYSTNVALGARYSTFPDRVLHPITGVSWYGAIKFCNWLTIHGGRGESQRCFSEGTSPGNWHPANITDAFWADGHDNSERFDWLRYQGFRLPMDDYASGPSYFNEVYKASAWSGTENVIYAFGRNSITAQDANYSGSLDPFEVYTIKTTPVGYYDGSNHGGAFQTTANSNPYGIHDLCGNVSEFVVDTVLSGYDNAYGTVRGGDWSSSVPSDALDLTAPRRNTVITRGKGLPYRGFRVVTTYP